MLTTFALLLFSLAGLRAQYNPSVQPIENTGAIDPQYICTSNLGTFVAGTSDESLWLLGNRGNVVGTTSSIETWANTSLATNHNSCLAVVTYDNRLGSNIVVRLWSNDGSTSEGILNMKNTTCLDAAVPTAIATLSVPGGMGAVTRIETNMDSKFLYIGFVTSPGHGSALGYAIYNIVSHSITVAPTGIIDPLGQQPAVGNSITVGCYKWSTSNTNSHFSYVWAGNSTGVPADFQPPISGTAVPSTILAAPAGIFLLEWLRVVCADNVAGAGITHWFYGSTGSAIAAAGDLWGGNGIATPTLIDAALEPHLAIPPMAVGDPYHNWTAGSNPGQSVFIVWPDISGTSISLKICRQFGWDIIPTPFFTSLPGIPVNFFTVGCNQMGILSIFDGGTATQIWRSFYHIDQDINENTLATGLNRVVANSVLGSDIWIWPADSLWLFAAQPNTNDEFQFDAEAFTLHAGLFCVDPAFDVTKPRSQIRCDDGAIVEYLTSGGIPSICSISIEARGSFLEEGAAYRDMNSDGLFANGNTCVPSTAIDNLSLLFFNAPFNANPGIGQIPGFSGGAEFIAEKAQLTWPPDATDPYPEIFNVNGSGTGINWDHCFVFFGPTNTSSSISTYGLVNLSMNGSATDDFQMLTLTNDLISCGRQPNSQGLFGLGFGGGGGLPPFSRADIFVENPFSVFCDNNTILYCDLRINDPVSFIDYSTNNISIAKRGIEFDELGASGSEAMAGDFFMNVNTNTVFENWPIGSSTDPATDFDIYNFSILTGGVPNPSLITINGNTFNAQASPPGFMTSPSSGGPGSWTGLFLEYSTTAGVQNNTFTDRNPAIHAEDPIVGRPFICSNTITGFSNGTSFGIQQDGIPVGASGFTKLNTITNCIIGFLGDGNDNTDLLNNFINHNWTALKFTGYAATIVNGHHDLLDDYPGQNQISNNTGGGIQIASYYAQPILGGPATDLNNQGLNSVVRGSASNHMDFTGTLPPGVPEYILTSEITGNEWNPSLALGAVTTDATLTPGVYWTNVDNGVAAISDYSCGSLSSAVVNKGSQRTLSVLDNSGDSLYLYNEALNWTNYGFQNGLDTMRLYCRQHPFATTAPGELLMGFYWISQFLQDEPDTALTSPNNGYPSPHKFIVDYNWFVDQQPLNMAENVQERILSYLAGDAIEFDRNWACNLMYNFSLLYDSSWSAAMWQGISTVRRNQQLRGEDTTPFYPVTLPLSHYPVPGGTAGVSSPMIVVSSSLSLLPNPASSVLTVDFSLAHEGQTLILIYDETGNTVKSVVNAPRPAGVNEVTVPLNNLPSGNYFVRMSSGTDVITKKLIIGH